MKKFRATSCYTVYCYTTVEANNEDKAYALPKEMDGGDFEMEEDYGIIDCHSVSAKEIQIYKSSEVQQHELIAKP